MAAHAAALTARDCARHSGALRPGQLGDGITDRATDRRRKQSREV